MKCQNEGHWSLNFSLPCKQVLWESHLIARAPTLCVQSGRWYLMSGYSVAFLFVECVAPVLIYRVLFKPETECRVINFLLCFSGVLFALSLEHFGHWRNYFCSAFPTWRKIILAILLMGHWDLERHETNCLTSPLTLKSWKKKELDMGCSLKRAVITDNKAKKWLERIVCNYRLIFPHISCCTCLCMLYHYYP